MKIICVGRNYVAHAKELNNDIPPSPMIFMKPQTALLQKNQPFYYPEFSNNIHYEGEIVLRICKNGRYIEPQFASKYYNQISYGIDFTARDIQDGLKKKGYPWEIAKAFDNSAALGEFLDITNLKDAANINLKTIINGKTVQNGFSQNMIFNFDTVVSYVSKFFTLKQGDLIYTGTPEGVGEIHIGDVIEGFIDDKKLLHCEIK
jgi:2-keto-4-pentenoate hydratase/2-oxohepta-3-ene-1,7-dioic acid hydratase in catechol pathway